jgi:hypothetical protein
LNWIAFAHVTCDVRWDWRLSYKKKKKNLKKKPEPFLIFYSKTPKNFTGGIDK